MTEEEKKAKLADDLMKQARNGGDSDNGSQDDTQGKTNEPEFVTVNGMKFPKERVNQVKIHIKGLTYKPSDDKEVAGVFMFQTKEQVWGTFLNESTQVREFIETARNFPASDWGVIPTLRQDMLLKNVVDDMIILSLTNPTQFEKEYGHTFDGVELGITQLYVPAHTNFINPYTTVAKPVGKSYEIDYVFTFIDSFKYDVKNINHKQFIKDIHDGCPRLNEDGEMKPTTKPFTLCAEDFVDSLIDMGYFGNVEDRLRERLYKSIDYKG